MDPTAAVAAEPRARGLDLDPEGYEPRALREAVDFTGARVLEIGSGDGRLSVRYARAAGRVVCIDLDAASLATGSRARPASLLKSNAQRPD